MNVWGGTYFVSVLYLNFFHCHIAAKFDSGPLKPTPMKEDRLGKSWKAMPQIDNSTGTVRTLKNNFQILELTVN